MIDEYGNEQIVGSKEFEEYLHYRMDKEFCNDISCGDMNKELALQYANEFFGYALNLQAEVKRLRKNERELLSAIEQYQFIEEVTIVDMIQKMKKVLGE